jgi:hypothetical protein
MARSPRRRTVALGTLALAGVAALALAVAALLARPTAPPAPPSGGLRIYRQPWSPPLVGPCGVAPVTSTVVTYAPGAPLAHPDGVAIARAPGAGGPVAATFFSPPPLPPGQIAFQYLADLRYDQGGVPVDVVTCIPSPAAAREELLLGDDAVALAPGRVGFASAGIHWQGPPPPGPRQTMSGPSPSPTARSSSRSRARCPRPTLPRSPGGSS